MNKRLYISLVIAIFLLAILLRVWNWPCVINDINCDEAMSAINAKSIAENGKDIYGTTYPVYFESWLIGGQSAFSIYIMAMFIKILGFSTFSVRLPILLITLSSLIFMLLLTNKIFKDKKVSLIILLLLAINPWDILQSQWSLDCNFFPHIFLIAVYLLYTGIEEEKNIYLYISMFVFAITLYTYGIALYLVPIFLLIVAIYLIKNHKITILRLLLCVFIFFVFALPIILMTIINLFNLPTITIGKLTIQNFAYVTRKSDMIIFSENKISTILENINCIKNVLLYQNDGLTWNSFPNFGTLYLISIPIIIFGIISTSYNYSKNKEENYTKFGMILMLVWLLVSIICGLLINNININRMNIVWYVLIIFNGIGIYEIIRLVKHKKTIIILFSILYIINTIGFINYYYKIGVEEIENSSTWSNGLVKAIEYANNVSGDEVIFSNSIIDTDKKDVFIRYATQVKQKEKYIHKEEFIKYYEKNKTANIDFSTNEKRYITQKIQNNIVLTDNVYIISKSECSKINNLNDYQSNVFNNYIVLVKI